MLTPCRATEHARLYDAGHIMYPMVQRQQDVQHGHHLNRNRDQRILEQQPTVSIISRGRYQQHDVLEPLQSGSGKQQESTDDEEEEQQKPKRPLHRRFFTYVREAWTGVKSALGNQFSLLHNFLKIFQTN